MSLSSMSTSRIRNVWYGSYHSRSQWVWGTMATCRGMGSGYSGQERARIPDSDGFLALWDYGPRDSGARESGAQGFWRPGILELGVGSALVRPLGWQAHMDVIGTGSAGI